MALNRVILFGRICKDPIFRQTTSGVPVCRFTVACDRQFANKQTGEREADFIECTAWRNTAEFISRYFSKGSAITVEGSLRNNNYDDKNGVKHYSYVVMAEQVGFGGKKEDNPNSQQQNVPQFGAVPQYGQAPPQAGPVGEPLNIGELGDFEEILSDGDTPF